MVRPVVVSAGIGIDSSTVLTLMAERDPRVVDLRDRLALVVGSDHGSEVDVTYVFRDQYLAPYLQERGIELVTVTPRVRAMDGQDYSNLYDYYLAQGMVPSRQRRSCTDRFKIQRVRQYAREVLGEQPLEMVIGFDCNEGNRAFKLANTPAYTYSCPLIPLGIDRLEASAILLRAGLPVPRRSACFCCVFGLAQDWWEMARRWPARYQDCVALEENVRQRRGREVLLGDKPLRDYPQPRVFRMPPEAVRLFNRAQSLLGQITPAWPSQAIALAARDLYGENWPAALRGFKVGPAAIDDPWQLYVRIEYCLELSGKIPPAYPLPCGAMQLAEPITLPSAGEVGPVL